MTHRSHLILIIEDSEEDFQTAKRLLERIPDRRIEHCVDAPAAMAWFRDLAEEPKQAAGTWPDVILLDLNMPGEDGRCLLLRLKRDERLRQIPVVIVTTSANPKDLKYCYENGAAGYIVKPVDLARFRTSLEQMANYWLRAVTLPPVGGTI